MQEPHEPYQAGSISPATAGAKALRCTEARVSRMKRLVARASRAFAFSGVS